MAKVKITLVKSVIGRPQDQRATVKSLGLTKVNSTVVQEATPDIRGKINSVVHLLKVEELAE